MNINKKRYTHWLNTALFFVIHAIFSSYAMEEIPATPTQLPQQITVKLMDGQKAIAQYKFSYDQYAPFSFLKNTVEDLGITEIPISVQDINKKALDFIYNNIEKITDKWKLWGAFNAVKERRPGADFFINTVKNIADYLENETLVEICHDILLRRAESYFEEKQNYLLFIQGLSTPAQLNSFLENPKKFIADLIKKRSILKIDEYMATLAHKIPFQENAPNLQWRTIKQLPFHISLTTFSSDKKLIALGSINPHKITLLQLPDYTFYKTFEIPAKPISAAFSNDNKKLYVGGENTLFEIDIESGNISEFNVQVPVKEFRVGQIKISPDNKILACFIAYVTPAPEKYVKKQLTMFTIENKNQFFFIGALSIHNVQFYSDTELFLNMSYSNLVKIVQFNLTNGQAFTKAQYQMLPEDRILYSKLALSSDKKFATWLFRINHNIYLKRFYLPAFQQIAETLIKPPHKWMSYNIKASLLKDLSVILFQIPTTPYALQILRYKMLSGEEIIRYTCPSLIKELSVDSKERVYIIFENGSIEMHDPAITFSLDQKLFVNGILQYYKQYKKPFTLNVDSELYEIWQTFNSIQQEQLKSYVTIEGKPIEPPAKKPKIEETGEELRGLKGKEEI